MHPDFAKQAGKDHVDLLIQDAELRRLLKKNL